VPGFTIMDDIDLQHLDTKSLHAMFQRDPFKILGRMAKEGGFDFPKALKKWDLEEHGHLTYSIYVIDFPSAVKVCLSKFRPFEESDYPPSYVMNFGRDKKSSARIP
jgi:hypothetical protein